MEHISPPHEPSPSPRTPELSYFQDRITRLYAERQASKASEPGFATGSTEIPNLAEQSKEVLDNFFLWFPGGDKRSTLAFLKSMAAGNEIIAAQVAQAEKIIADLDAAIRELGYTAEQLAGISSIKIATQPEKQPILAHLFFHLIDTKDYTPDQLR